MECYMLSKKFLSKALNAVSALALSGVLLGSALTNLAQAMDEEVDSPSIKANAVKYDPLIALAASPLGCFSNEIILELMIHTVGAKKELPLAGVSKYFHSLSCDQKIFRAITIKSEDELKELFASRNPSREKVLTQGMIIDGYELPLVPGIKITHEANPTFANIK